MIKTTEDLEKAFKKTIFAEEDAPVWAGLDIEFDHVYVQQGSYLGGSLISLADTYEGHGEDCLFIQELLRLAKEGRLQVKPQ